MDALTAVLSLGAPLSQACVVAEVAEQTVRNWQRRGAQALADAGTDLSQDGWDLDLAAAAVEIQDRRYVEFLWALRRARAAGVVANLIRIRDSTDWRSAAWLLERSDDALRLDQPGRRGSLSPSGSRPEP